MRKSVIVFFLLILLMRISTAMAKAHDNYRWVKMDVERLPNLNIPRIGHAVFSIGGEVVAAGGHTSGFVPTSTAEYYRDGAWHLMQMAYPHDQGVTAVLETGEVLLAGGHKEELGIGQTFTLELYNPSTHSFRGYGCLDKKRCFASALPVDSGRIVISGNWYADDGIELYDGSRQCKFVKPAAQHRSLPYIIRTSADNAIIFSTHDYHAKDFDTIIIDRLKGEPFTVSLFETWKPFCHPTGYHVACFIGNEAKGDYTNLIQVLRGDSLMAIARVDGESFSLLPTDILIPMQSPWGQIKWYSTIMADRNLGRAYIVGNGEDLNGDTYGCRRFYVVAVDYQKSPAPITLYYSEPMDSVGICQPVLTDDGALMVAGGEIAPNNNYDAASSVLLLHVGTKKPSSQESRQPLWLWPAVLVFLIALTITFIIRHSQTTSPPNDQTTSPPNDLLMERICRYMEEQHPYLNSELKVQDVADALGSNRTYISTCIKNIRGCTFKQFVNTYRVEYAKKLLQQHPGKKISEVCMASGFSTEVSFFRTFKAVTGMTPKDWMAGKAIIDEGNNDT